MRRYETIIILKPTLGDDENQAVLDRAAGNIEDGGGALIKTSKWGLRTLAYEIQKEQQGYYFYIQYSGTPDAVAEMERLFRIDDRVMKYLTVKLQDVYTHMAEDDIEENEASETEKSETPETSEEAEGDKTPEEKPSEETEGDKTPEEKPADDDSDTEEAAADEPAEEVEE